MKMQKKSHKAHRHRDANGRRLTKGKSHHKRKPAPVSQVALEPIQEVSKEKVRIDKNACGDFIGAQHKEKESKHSREKNVNIFSKTYLKKLQNLPNEKLSVRHHSLEKDNSKDKTLIEKTAKLFRKEKSFNDAVQELSVSKTENKDAKLRHRSRRKEKHKQPDERHKKHPKKERKKHKSGGDKSSTKDNKQLFSRVQEVIFCQMNHVPYKMKNDKTCEEIKDLYRRIKKEEKPKKQEKEYDKESLQNSPDRKHHKEKSKSHSKRKHDEDFHQNESQSNDRKHRKHKHREKNHEEPERNPEQVESTKGHGKNKISNISLGPYEKYFAFNPTQEPSENHHRKPSKKSEISTNVDVKHKHKKRNIEESKQEIVEDKIHEIVQGDMKTYFGKIQNLIDKKLDALLKVKEKHNEFKESKSKRSGSPTKRSNRCDKEEKAKSTEENITKEEIIEEVLKRLKMSDNTPEKLEKNEDLTASLEPTHAHRHSREERVLKTENLDRKKREAKDSLEILRNAARPPPELLIPVEGYCRACKEEHAHARSRRQRRSPQTLIEQPQIAPHLNQIFVPPENFRGPQFVVQGIEPPSLEQPTRKPHRKLSNRNLECKTVSVIGIPPQTQPRAAVNQTQTSSKSTNPDKDLVEKRKKSRRFKLYYKYSMSENVQEEESTSSEGKSVISDSCRVFSDPSEEETVAVCRRNAEEKRGQGVSAELGQAYNIPVKKWNRISTPRNSYLNNIIEEPSNISIQNEYFIPIRGGIKECYFRALTSSHSEYCFKINKKNANSNISIQSKDTWDGCCRYCRRGARSKSDFKIFAKKTSFVFRSKSDIVLGEHSGKHVIKTLFLEDTPYPFVRPKRANKHVESMCQTSQVQMNQKQFTDIYNTIDSLEQNIHKRHQEPKKVDVALSPTCLSTDKIADKKHQFTAIYKTLDNLEDMMVAPKATEKVDVAVGSQKSHRTSRSEPRKKFCDTAVGSSHETRHKSDERKFKLTSTGVSPIRIKEKQQDIPKSPVRTTTTPRSPIIKPYASRLASRRARNATGDSISPSSKKPVSKIVEAKKEPVTRKPIIKTPECVKVPKKDGTTQYETISEISKAEGHSSNTKPKDEPRQLHKRDLDLRNMNSQKNASKESDLNSSCIHYSYPIKDNLERKKITTPITVNTAAVSIGPTLSSNNNKLINVGSSTSSSVSDGAAHTQQIRRSKSLVEVRSRKSPVALSKSDLMFSKCFTKGESVASNNMEKFTNRPNLVCRASRSNVNSLDNYIENKFTSRLFLTKDYKGQEVSSYQRRKLYDQSIRQKMKKKFRFPKMDVSPQIFEVRFLSMVDQDHSSNEIGPVIALNLGSLKSDDEKRKKEEQPKNKKEKVTRELYKSTKITQSTASEDTTTECSGNLNNKDFPTSSQDASSVTQLYVNDKKLAQDKVMQFCKQFLEANNNLCSCDEFTENCRTCKKFARLMNMLRNSALSSHTSYGEDANTKKKLHVDDDDDEGFLVEQGQAVASTIFKNPVDCVSLTTTNKTPDNLTQPMSCPVLATRTSSFDFLYEETSSSENEVVLAKLTRPFDQAYNFSMSQYNVEGPFSCHSPTVSTESGYASVKSKGVESVSSFFKKPNIAALLTPNLTIRKKKEIDEIKQSDEEKETSESDKMEEFKEYSLEFLLGRNSSVLLETEAISVHSESHKAEADPEICVKNSDDQVEETGEGLKTVSKTSISFSNNGCKLILSNEYLKIDSVTYLEAEVFTDNSESISKKSSKEEVSSNYTLNFSLDSNNPFAPNFDVLTQQFFTSLLKMYEKEMKVCQRLYEDDSFLKVVLLPAVEQRKCDKKKGKKGKLSKFFKKRGEETLKHQFEEEQCFFDDESSNHLKKLASNAKKYFSMFVEAVKVNQNIDNEIKVCGLLKLLERIESGDFRLMSNDCENFEENIRKQVTEAFINVYEICTKTAKKYKKSVGDKEIGLIKAFVTKYKIGLLFKTDVVACYIGRGIIQTEMQLKAAVTYLVRSNYSVINMTEFDEFCEFFDALPK